jgi:Tol biopolymer transport system component
MRNRREISRAIALALTMLMSGAAPTIRSSSQASIRTDAGPPPINHVFSSPRANGKLAFIGSSDGAGIYTMNPDGSDLKRLLSDAGVQNASWSPDGNHILFAHRELVNPYPLPPTGPYFLVYFYLIDADGGNLRLILSFDDRHEYFWYPAWSPDGSKILSVYSRKGSLNELVVMNFDGSERKSVAQSPTVYAPTWSPDGSQIAFSASGGLSIINVDGSNLRTFSNVSGCGWYEWSPDGSKFVFSCGGLSTVNTDGSNRKQITAPAGSAFDYAPHWSPDASKIAFVRETCEDPSCDYGNSDTVMVINADGSGKKSAGMHVGAPVWSPDGSKIVFADSPDYVHGNLFVMNADTSGLAMVPNSATTSQPSWQSLPFVPPPPNPIDDAQAFVRQHYLDFLSREPDDGGLAYWTNEITKCGSDAACIHARRVDVSASFFVENEFQQTGYFVYRLYRASLGRQPNYSEFNSDRSKIVVGPGLESSKQAFAEEWVQRDVFRQTFSNTLSNTEFVNKLFDTAGLTASTYDTQRQQEIQATNSGRSRALVLRDVIEIPDFKNLPDTNDPRYSEIKRTSQYNSAFVLMQYFGYLRRGIDQGGFDFWLDVVNNREPNNYPGMVCAFVTSSEYQLRFGLSVTRTNSDCGR